VRRVENLVTFMCRLSINSGSLCFLEPQGSVQACVAIDFTFTFLPCFARQNTEHLALTVVTFLWVEACSNATLFQLCLS